MPVWHASVAAVDTYKGITLDVEKLSDKTKQQLIIVSKNLLKGVGEMPSRVEQFKVAIHYRKTLSVHEIARLTTEWCSIPAIDEGGDGIILEENT